MIGFYYRILCGGEEILLLFIEVTICIMLINILCFDFLDRILSCFKLNPFEHLNLSFDSSIDDVKKQYRKVTSTCSKSCFI